MAAAVQRLVFPKGTFLKAVGMYAVARVFLLTQAAILTSSLDAQSQQAWALIDSWATFGFVVGDLGVRSLALRALSATPSHEFERQCRIFWNAQAVAALLMGALSLAGALALSDLHLSDLTVAALAIFSLTAFGPFSMEWRLTAMGRIDVVARNRMLFEMSSLACIACFVASLGIRAYALGCVAGVLVVAVLNGKTLRNIYKTAENSSLISTLRAALVLWIMVCVSHVWLRTPVWMLTHGGDGESVAWFSTKVFMVGLEALSVASQIFYPRIVKFLNEDVPYSKNEYARLIRPYLGWSFLAALGVLIVGLGLGWGLVRLEVLTRFVSSYAAIVALTVGLCAWIVVAPYTSTLLALRKENLLAGIFLGCFVITIAIVVSLGRHAAPAAIAIGASSVFYGVCAWIFAKPYLTESALDKRS